MRHLRPWMQVLVWLGLGGGIGFFAGMKVGCAKADKDLEMLVERQDEVILGLQKRMDDMIQEKYTIPEKGVTIPVPYEDPGDIPGVEKAMAEYNPVVLEPDEDPEMPMEEPEMPDDPLAEDEEDDPDEVIPDLHPQDMLPHPITEDEFNLNPNNYDITDLEYLADDDVIYDPEYDEEMASPEQVLGIGWFALFGPNTPVIFIENESMETLYRVTYKKGSLKDYQGG